MLYTTLKFIHIVSIAIWVGGLITLLVMNSLLMRAGERTAAQAIGRLSAGLRARLFMPAMVVTVITGIGMAQVAQLDFGSLWIIWGIVGVIASVILGAVFTGGAARRLAQQMATGSIEPAQAAAAQRRIVMLAMLNVVLLLSIVWAMVAKPH